MSDFDEKIIERLRRLEREVERLQVKERPVVITDHGALTGLGDDDHTQYLLTTGKAADSDKLDGFNSTDFGRPVFLTTPKTSTNWDGDARSTTAKTKIDLSEVFGIPAGVKAIIAKVSIRDSGSATSPGPAIILSPNDTSYSGKTVQVGGRPNDYFERGDVIVPCNSDGDIYYQIDASGTETLDAWIEIWGYWL